MTAAFRFFDNDRVIFASMHQPHLEAAHRRIAEQLVVFWLKTRPKSI